MAFEFYTLDENLRKVEVIEGHTSFIWTERNSAWGDISIDIPATDRSRSLLSIGTFLACSESTYIMKIETVQDATDDSNAAMLKVTGRSFEAILDDRVAILPAMVDDIANNPNWTITDTPGNVARTIFKTICVDLVNDPGDAIPFYVPGTILPPGSSGEPTEIISVAIPPTSVYSAIKQVCDTYGLGFRLVRAGETSRIFFEIFTGDDRTSAQTTRAAVIFSPSMDNLSNTTKLTSDAAYKTNAYVIGKDQVKIVYGVGENTEATGFNRRVLVVDASDIGADTVSDVDAALSQKGLAALAQAQKVYQFDGEVSQYGVYKYGVDYKMGDLIEERDNTGFGNEMKVIEQILVSDVKGDRSYPTLSLTLVIVPGTWSAWTPPEQPWVDVPEKEVWANQ
jgi:hypothetical protein